MPNKLVVLCSFVLLAVTSAYAASPEQPNSVPIDQNSLQILIDKANKGDAEAQFMLAEAYDTNPKLNVGLREISDLLQKAAEQGHAGAQCSLAHMYLSGTGRPKNYENAIFWFSKAAEQGDPKSKFYAGLSYMKMALEAEIEAIISKKKDEGGKINSLKEKGAKYILSAKTDLVQLANRNDHEAQYILARMTNQGLGIMQPEKDVSSKWIKIAIQELTVTASSNNIKAQRLLGEIYEFDWPDIEKSEESAKWYMMAAEQGDPISQYHIGSHLIYLKKYAQALPWLLKATERGHFEALNQICETGSYALQNEKNYAFALEWLEKAAERGHANAQYELGCMLSTGKAIPSNKEIKPFLDDQKAVTWLIRAAEQNHVAAQYELAGIYHYNDQLQDPNKALYWYRKAAEQGYTDAQEPLAMMYYDGKDVAKDCNEAFKWFMEYAKTGHGYQLTISQFCIGDMYFSGKGVLQNYQEARKWFTFAGESGDYLSQYQLGKIYYDGLGVDRNMRQAAKWYRDAANGPMSLAKFCLAQMYYRGEGVPQDYVEAYKWAILASIDGDYVAFRDQLKKEMTVTQIEEGQKAAREFQNQLEGQHRKNMEHLRSLSTQQQAQKDAR